MRRRLTLAACALALAVTAASATLATASAEAAGTYQGTLTITSVAKPNAPDQPIVVTAQGAIAQQCDPTVFCGYYPKVTTVPASVACRPQLTREGWIGDVYDDATGRQPQAFTATWQERPWLYAGPKRACLYAFDGAADTLVAETSFDVPGAPAPAPARPDPRGRDLVRAAIPRSVGVRHAYGYELSSANVPRNVGAKRFAVLARVAAKRWGLRETGTTVRAPRQGDGRNTVGFARDVPRVALGVTRIRSVRYYRRSGGVTRIVGERVVERDLSLALGVPWWVGPGPPPSNQVDLQTVIVHELGHYAGNDHVRNCTNSPMWTGLRPGEWWYSRSDWFQFGCPNVPSPTAIATAATARTAARFALAPGDPRPLLVQRSVRRVFLD
ncbi:hypothetical protein [Conexibacter sp. CPCC 206217]|uniref:hypothetical protein n=1 Tax=Conexibacter sp. CPCC 206217 TaxID=3064574 RepID=UPI002722B3A3|nr:hypothetical protein [Conexibacter sp. CPCC 206217]MDO8214038.1 hypothetical protein [Conexibacter sp. CPCC 206217]